MQRLIDGYPFSMKISVDTISMSGAKTRYIRYLRGTHPPYPTLPLSIDGEGFAHKGDRDLRLRPGLVLSCL